MKHPGLQKALSIAARHRAVVGPKPLYAQTSEERASLYIYESIGEDWWSGEGITAKKVAEALAAVKGKSLDIFINSGGGDIFEAKAIVAELSRFKGEKHVHVDGIAASAATFIAMAGDKIITAPAATWMIHEVSAWTGGRASDFRALADVLDMENKTFAETYAKRTKQSVEDVLAWMNAETWMNATTAKERGFTDEISDDGEGDAAVQAALASPKETERLLREAGLSRSQAKALMARGFEGLRAQPRDADADELSTLQTLSTGLRALRG